MLSHWQAHKSQLHGYINARVDDPMAVDDILQEVYIKASTHLHQLQSKGSLKGWLYRIAHNAIMDHYRSQKPHDELPENLVAEEAHPGEKAHQEVAQCLGPLIEELPEKYRTPLKMSELEGTPQQQIADRLGLSLSGAKSRVQRGRAKLRERLTACCDIEVGRGGVIDYQPKDSHHNGC